MAENRTKITVNVDETTVEKVKQKLEHGGLSDTVRQALNRVADNEDVARKRQLKKQLNTLRDNRKDLKNDKREIENELQTINTKIERAEAQLDELRDKEGEYEGHLASISEMLQEDENKHVFPGVKQVKKAAVAGGVSREEVIEDLKERNPDLPKERFTEGRR